MAIAENKKMGLLPLTMLVAGMKNK